MSDEKPMVDEQLEARLAGLTEWQGPTAGAFERARAATGSGPGLLARWAGRVPKLRPPRRLEVAAVVAVGGVAVLAVSSRVARMNAGPAERAVAAAAKAPDVPTAFYRYKAADTEWKAAAPGQSNGVRADDWADLADSMAVSTGEGWRGEGTLKHFGTERYGESPAGDRPAVQLQGAERFNRQPDAAGPPVRQIIRRAMMDVVAPDVMGAFRKAQDLVKPEAGEFVQETTVSGSGQAMSARVVLRVDPARLVFVMQSARGLGALAAEQTGGDDVTDRLTDLDAQIRNEQRVEKEMLDLFDLRKDAPLKDVLELREQLARVRGTIERLQAQKAQAERLVALATLTVTIRPEPDKSVAPPPVDETPSFGARVSQSVSRAWERGTNSLAGFAGWSVETLVGGLPVWGTVAVVGVVAWRVVKRRRDRRGAAEA